MYTQLQQDGTGRSSAPIGGGAERVTVPDPGPNQQDNALPPSPTNLPPSHGDAHLLLPSPSGNVFQRHEKTGAWLVAFDGDGHGAKPFSHRVPFSYMRVLLAVPGVPHPPILLREMVEDGGNVEEYKLKVTQLQRSGYLDRAFNGVVDQPKSDGVERHIDDGDDLMITRQDLRKLDAEIRALRTGIEDLELQLQGDGIGVMRREEIEGNLVEYERKLSEKCKHRRAVSYKQIPLKYAGSPHEKARILVCKHIRAAIELLRKGGMVRMAQHLDRHIQNKGTKPGYYDDQVFCT
jgi:hypothetical protein